MIFVDILIADIQIINLLNILLLWLIPVFLVIPVQRG